MMSFKYISDPAVLAIDKGMTGKEADMCTKLYGSILVKKQPFLGLELPNITYLEKMIESADLAGYYQYKDEFNICAFYKHDETFPISRSYYIKLKTLSDCEAVLQNFNKSGEILSRIDDVSIFMFTEQVGHEKRVDEFFSKVKHKSKVFKGLFEGRKKHTTTESGMFLSSDGCLVCGDESKQMINTTVSGDKGVLFGFNLCQVHAEECKSANSNIEYLSSVCDVESPVKMIEFSLEDRLKTVIKMLVDEFNCKIGKIDKDTITAYRNDTDFKLVFRLTTEMNYGYMIFQPDEEDDIARFDSANHHNVNYGPDHLHRDLKNENENAESSFMTGYPVIDKKGFRKVLEEKEREFYKKTEKNKSKK